MRCRVDEGQKVCSRLSALWQGGLARVFPGAADTLAPANQVTRGGLDFLASVSRFARFSQRILYLQQHNKEKRPSCLGSCFGPCLRVSVGL